MSPFIPGIELSRQFYHQAVRPILDTHYPNLPHTAALIGYGSDVIGFDTEMSTDHMWGPRLVLFLSEQDHPALAAHIHETLRWNLPLEFHGYPTNFGAPDEESVRLLKPIQAHPVEHLIFIETIQNFFHKELGVDPYADLSIPDWLTFEEHRLLSLTAGEVFHDNLGLEQIRQKFHYYPQQIWLYLLEAAWMKISQEEPFVGRTGLVGDDLGSAILTARLAQYLMHLCFLMEKRYAPYSKWFGSAFQRLTCAPQVTPHLQAALSAANWQTRQAHLCRAYTEVARLHNHLQITPPIEETPSNFHGRPFLVIHGEVFSEAIRNTITDPAVLALPPHVGSINQFIDSVDVRDEPRYTRTLQALYSQQEQA